MKPHIFFNDQLMYAWPYAGKETWQKVRLLGMSDPLKSAHPNFSKHPQWQTFLFFHLTLAKCFWGYLLMVYTVWRETLTLSGICQKLLHLPMASIPLYSRNWALWPLIVSLIRLNVIYSDWYEYKYVRIQIAHVLSKTGGQTGQWEVAAPSWICTMKSDASTCILWHLKPSSMQEMHLIELQYCTKLRKSGLWC